MRRSSGFRGAWRGMLGVLAVLLAVGALPLWSAAAPPQREIVGGSPVKAGTMPFMAAFLWLPAGEEYPWCAATLVTPDTVLTAASCLYYLGYVGEDLVLAEIAPEDLAVVVQGRGNTPLAELKRIAVTSIEYSPGFDVSSCGLSLMALSNIFACADDAALLRLAAPVRGAAPVTLIEPGSDGYWQKGQRLTAAGWSGEFLAQPPPGPLTRAALPVFDREVCGRRYERLSRNEPDSQPVDFDELEGSFCVYKTAAGPCFEEWGGPALVRDGKRWLQAGILTTVLGCAEGKWPYIYTGLADPELNRWIRSAAGASSGPGGKGGR